MIDQDQHELVIHSSIPEGHFHPGTAGRFHPQSWADGIMPLTKFPDDYLWYLMDLAHRPKPPPRWIDGEMCQFPSRAWHEWHWTRGLRLRHVEGYEPKTRPHIPDSLRLAVYERDGFACLHCGTTERLSLDHIYPYSLGGADTMENLQTLCRPCNSRKGARV